MSALTIRRAAAVPAAIVLLATGTCLVAGCGDVTISGKPGTSASGPAPSRQQDGNGAAAELTVAADKAGHQWAPAASAELTPGTQTYTQGAGQCTSDYVFVDDAGNVYLGQAAHCASTGQSDRTNGCSTGSLPLDTPVTYSRNGSPIRRGEVVGTGELAYSSWLVMQRNGESDRDTCAYNDLALVKIAADDVGTVNPSMPYWGGPAGIDTTGAGAGDRVYSYGNSSLRGGLAGLSPQTGETEADQVDKGSWTHALNSPTPGIPGDSGSAYLDREGRALGILSTVGFGLPIVNNIGDIGHEIAYAQAHSGITGLRLVLGTEPFDPNR